MFNAPLSPSFVRLALWFERWVLAGLSLFFACDHLITLRLLHLIRTSRAILPPSLAQSDAGLVCGVNFNDVARYGMLAAANGVAALFLLSSRRPTCPPRRALEVVLPFAATYSSVLLNLPGLFPAWATTPLVPPAWEVPLAACGLTLSTIGGTLSLGGLLWLGRSLGIFVSVRRVVLVGPYRRVRHPIYAGYALSLGGFALTGCTPRLAILVTTAIGLLVWRAHLEEAALCEASPAYRRRLAVTGFFLPRMGPPPRRGLGGRPAGATPEMTTAEEERGNAHGNLARAPLLLSTARSLHG